MNRVLLLVAAWPPLAHAQVTVDWNQPTEGLSIALDQSDNVYTVDYEYALGGDITLTKRSSTGDLQWTAAFDQTSTTMFDKATWVATDQQGNAIVTGTVMSGYSDPVNANSIVMKFDSTGDLLWRQVYETFFDGSYTRKCVVDKAGNIYVLGLGTGPDGFVTKVKKFAPDGTAMWSWFDAAGIGAAHNIKWTPDSGLVVVGRGLVGSVNGYAKLDRDGNTIWSLAGIYSITAGDAAGDANGNTYCVHENYGGTPGSVVRKLSPTGGVLWQNTYDITAFRVEVGTDGAPVLSGFPGGGGGGAAFMKVDTAGAMIWSNPDADGPNVFLLHAQMMMDEYDNAYLCAGTLFAMGVCKVDSGGATAWFITTPTGNSQGFALGGDHHVYVTGGATARLGQSLATGIQSAMAGDDDLPRAFPVPAVGQVNVQWPGHVPVHWRIRSVPGSLWGEGRWTGAPIALDAVPSGTILVELTDEAGVVGVVRVLVE